VAGDQARQLREREASAVETLERIEEPGPVSGAGPPTHFVVVCSTPVSVR
jgi:hypothetical protein